MFRCPRIVLNNATSSYGLLPTSLPLIPNQGKSVISIDIIHHIPCIYRAFHNVLRDYKHL